MVSLPVLSEIMRRWSTDMSSLKSVKHKNIYLKLVLGFIFLIFPLMSFQNIVISFCLLGIVCLLPGLALIKLLKLRFDSKPIETFFALNFSLLILMGIFTMFSVFTHAIGLTKPFSTLNIYTLMLVIILLSLGVLGRENARDREAYFQSFSWTSFLPRVVACLFPVISLYCVSRLNNQRDSRPTIIFLIFSLLLLLLMTIFKELLKFSLNEGVTAWFIYGISCSLLLGTTFRGNGGFWGFDINSEYFAALKVADHGFWISPQGNSPYDSMLSITVLPVVLSIFTKFNLIFIFKIFYPLVLAFIPTVIFSLGSKYFSRLTIFIVLLGTVFGSISFIPQLPALSRQIVASSFLIGLLLVPHQIAWKKRHKTIVTLLMSLGIAISHYSTSYLVSAIFGLSIIPLFFVFIISPKSYVKRKGVFTISVSLGIILLSVLWNGILTNSVEAVNPVITNVTSQGLDFLPSQDRNLLLRWFKGTVSADHYNATDLRRLDKANNIKKGVKPYPESATYHVEAVKLPVHYIFGQRFGIFFGNLIFISRTFFQIVSVVGTLIFLRLFLNARRLGHLKSKVFAQENLIFDIFPLAMSSLLIGLVARISGSLAPFYNPERVAITLLFALLIPTFFLVELLLFGDYVAKSLLVGPVLAFAFVLVINSTSLGGYVLGSDVTRISSYGEDKSPFIISANERGAVNWFDTHVPTRGYLQTDSHGSLALLQVGRQVSYSSVDPYSLAPHSFIYASNSNVVGGVANSYILYKFPRDYIDQHYDLIYSSPRAQVFH